MIVLNISERELWDEATEEFINIKPQVLQLEHSLLSVSKWESKWHKPFMTKDPKPRHELLDYIRCMSIGQNTDPQVFKSLTRSEIDKITQYIDDPMTATTFTEDAFSKGGKQTILTSELIYYMMIQYNIPFECQKWHLNRLITLIRVCNVRNEKPKKMSKNEILSRNKALNDARRAKMRSKG